MKQNLTSLRQFPVSFVKENNYRLQFLLLTLFITLFREKRTTFLKTYSNDPLAAFQDRYRKITITGTYI